MYIYIYIYIYTYRHARIRANIHASKHDSQYHETRRQQGRTRSDYSLRTARVPTRLKTLYWDLWPGWMFLRGSWGIGGRRLREQGFARGAPCLQLCESDAWDSSQVCDVTAPQQRVVPGAWVCVFAARASGNYKIHGDTLMPCCLDSSSRQVDTSLGACLWHARLAKCLQAPKEVSRYQGIKLGALLQACVRELGLRQQIHTCMHSYRFRPLLRP